MQNIAYNIRTLRKEQGLTQEELAAQLHVTRQAVSSWERGGSCPDFDTLKRLGEVLGAAPEQLLERNTPSPRAPYRRVRYVGPILLALAGYLFCTYLFGLNYGYMEGALLVGQIYLCILVVGYGRTIIDELRNWDYYKQHPDGLPPDDEDEE